METRKSQPSPLRIRRALAKSYGDLFYTPKSLQHFLLLAKFSSDSKACSGLKTRTLTLFNVLNCRLLFHLTFTSLTRHHALHPVLSRLLFHLTFTSWPCGVHYYIISFFVLVHLMGTN